VHFAFSDDQLAFADAVRGLLAKECPPAVVRAAWAEGAPAWPAELWADLAGMGVVGLTAPEHAGGLGLGELDWVLLLEEAGRAALPAPLLEHTCVALPVLAALGDDRVGPAAAGDLVATVAFADWPHVAYGADADLVVLVDADGVVVLEDPATEPVAPLDGARRLARLAAGAPSGPRSGDAALAAAARRRALLGASAELVGIGQAVVALAADYAKQRKQFGAAIGSFQAVKHHLANAHLKLEYARPVVHRAAWSLAQGLPEAGVHVAMAKAMAADAATLATRAALQVHGAIGYTFEYDLQLWMKRAWALARWLGDAAVQREAIALELLGPPPPSAP
jgi:alkylation response protein AidB-like acyl-CoA dehydrogenase